MSDYTVQDLEQQLKPLSKNGFVAFFQKIWRWWLGVWYNFAEKHHKLSNLIYMVFFFIVFSYGVTIWQYIVMTFLPLALTSLGTEPWGWPNIPIEIAGNQPYILFGDAKGLGYFIAFELAVFTAQCINFPLQRNITYRSHGNPWYQAMWYFIGWVLVSIFTNAIWGICNCFLVHWGWPDAVTGLLKTVLTGGVSMVIFFFVFLVIFPNDVKVAAKKKAKYEKLVAANAPAEKIEKAKAAYEFWQAKADLSTAEKEAHTAASQVNSKVMRYFSYVKKAEELAGKPADTETAKKNAAKSKEKYDKLVAAKADAKKIEKAKAEYELWQEKTDPAYEERARLAKTNELFEAAAAAIEAKKEKEAAYLAVKEAQAQA